MNNVPNIEHNECKIEQKKSNTSLFKSFLFILLTLVIASPALISSAQGKVRYTPENVQKLFPSSTRQVIELSGNWDRSINDGDFYTVSLPFTEVNKKKVTYRKNLSIDPNMVKKYAWSLHFFGLNDQVEVYFNNQLIGKYFGAMTPFSVNIHQNLIKNGQNVLQLVVTPADRFSEQIKDRNIYFKQNNIGILREVFLVGTPQVWVKDIEYQTQLNSDFTSANVKAKVSIASGQLAGLNVVSVNDTNARTPQFSHGKARVSVSAAIYSHNDKMLIAESAPTELTMENERTNNLNFSFNITNPYLWSPSNPKLYFIKVKVLSGGVLLDEFSQNMGVRNVKTNGKGGILVNGKEFVIKGVDYIDDHYASGSSLSPFRMEQDIISIKTLGANLVRFKYAVPHPYMAYLCDKYGLFFTVDVPLYNVPANFFNIYEIKSRMKNLADRITDNYNSNPASFGYCVSEGIIETPQVSTILGNLVSRFKVTTDRLIIKSVLLGSREVVTDGIDLFNVVDNRKYQTYEMLNKQLKNILTYVKDKPVTINFGFPIQINNSNGYTDPLSMEAQRNYMLHNANLVNNNRLAGLIFWAFNDYKVNNPLMSVNNNEQDVASVGLMNRGRQQRLSYSTLQSIYTSQEEQPLLTAGSYSESIPLVYIVGVILLIIILFMFTQRFKRFREYLTRSILRPYNFYADIRDQRIISIGQTFMLAIITALSLGLYTSSIMYYLRTSDIAQQVIMAFNCFDALLPGFFSFVWNPIVMIGIIAAIYLLSVFVFAGFIRLLSLFVKSRIYYTDTITILVWASVPLLILLPLSLFMIKLLSSFPYLTLAVLLATLLLFVWVLFRVIKASTVVFDVRPAIAYSLAAVIVGIMLGSYVFALNSVNSAFSFINYLSQYLLNS